MCLPVVNQSVHINQFYCRTLCTLHIWRPYGVESPVATPGKVVGGLKGFYEGRAVSLPVMDNGGEGTSISAGGTDMFVQCMP